MKIGTVLTATDSNPLYAEFIPLFVDAWKRVLPEADVCVLYIGHSLPDSLSKYSQYIHVIPPIPGMHTAFHAQCIRLLYPREIARDEGVLITDMDMIPLNRRYYVSSIEKCPNDAFVVYRDVCLPHEISMCYNVAHPSTWTSIFGLRPTNDTLSDWYATSRYDGVHGGSGWSTDQIILVNKFNEWSGTKSILRDADTKFQRLDRGMPIHTWAQYKDLIKDRIRAGVYADYHCLRPYSTYKEWNDWVLMCLNESTQ